MRYESCGMIHTVLCRTNDDHIYWCTVVPCLTELKDLPNGDRYQLFKIHIVKSILTTKYMISNVVRCILEIVSVKN